MILIGVSGLQNGFSLHPRCIGRGSRGEGFALNSLASDGGCRNAESGTEHWPKSVVPYGSDSESGSAPAV